MTQIDPERDAAWQDLRARREARDTHSKTCDHHTCPGCSCTCHKKPKPSIAPATPAEAFDHAHRLKQAAVHATKLLDAITSTDKTRPRSWLEEAITRANADLDTAMRSPTLNGAVSGGDDPSYRILESITTREVLDADGNVLSGGDIRERVDVTARALEELIAALTDIGQRAATAYAAVDDLRSLSPIEAEQILKAESDVQPCVHCGRVVTGARDDRLKAGRCNACYEYRRTHNGQDRPTHLIEADAQPAVGQTADQPIHDPQAQNG